MVAATKKSKGSKKKDAEQEETKPTLIALPKDPGERKQIAVELLDDNPHNPRKRFDPDKILEIASSFVSIGQIEPMVVRPKGERFEIVTGHTRKRAAERCQLQQLDCIVRELTDAQALIFAIVENTHRGSLAPLEQAAAYAQLQNEHKMSTEEIAAEVGESPAHVYQRMRLMKLSPACVKAIDDDRLTIGAALQLARLEDHAAQDELLAAVAAGPYRSCTPPARVRDMVFEQMRELKDAAFDTADAELVPAAGSCTACPKNTSAQRSLFDDLNGRGGRCTDGTCWNDKLKAHGKKKLDEAKSKGLPILDQKQSEKIFEEWEGRFEVKPNAPVMDLNARTYIGGKHTTVRQALKEKKKEVEVKVAVDSEGHVHELVDRSEVEALMPKSERSSGGGKSAKATAREKEERKKQIAKGKKERAEQSGIVAAIVARGEKKQDLAYFRVIAMRLIETTWSNIRQEVAHRRELGKDMRVPEADTALKKLVQSMKDVGALAGLVLELITPSFRTDMSKPIANELGVDWKKAAAAGVADLNAKIEGEKAAKMAAKGKVPEPPKKKAKAKKAARK